MDIIKNMKSEPNIWYLDDGTIAGNVQTVLSNYNNILKALSTHWLEVNPSKCELFLIKPKSEDCIKAFASFREIADGIQLVCKDNLTLLGALIFPEAIDKVLESKLEDLKLMSSHLTKIDNHQALFLMRNCFGIPKLTYFLRSSPCLLQPKSLERYDQVIKKTLIKILNIQLNDQAWIQATLRISKGGLGLRPSSEVSLSAYLSSTTASASIVESLLPAKYFQNVHYDSALSLWKHRLGFDNAPQNPSCQSSWDKPGTTLGWTGTR